MCHILQVKIQFSDEEMETFFPLYFAITVLAVSQLTVLTLKGSDSHRMYFGSISHWEGREFTWHS